MQLLTVLADAGTVHAAANVLNLSQPAVSKMLKEVEDAFGARLFERGSKGIAMNRIGVAAIRRMRVVLGELSGAVGEIDDIRNGAGSLLRVGTLSVTATIPPAIVALKARVPGIVIRIKEGPVDELIEDLLDGRLDCVFGAISSELLRSNRVGELDSEVIREDRICVLASSRHKLSRKRRLSWRDLQSEDWVTPSADTVIYQGLLAAFVRDNLRPPTVRVETMSPVTTASLVRLDPSLLAAIRLEHARVEVAGGSSRILPVYPHAPLPPLSLLTRRGSERSDALRAFASVLRRTAAAEKSRRSSC